MTQTRRRWTGITYTILRPQERQDARQRSNRLNCQPKKRRPNATFGRQATLLDALSTYHKILNSTVLRTNCRWPNRRNLPNPALGDRTAGGIIGEPQNAVNGHRESDVEQAFGVPDRPNAVAKTSAMKLKQFRSLPEPLLALFANQPVLRPALIWLDVYPAERIQPVRSPLLPNSSALHRTDRCEPLRRS